LGFPRRIGSWRMLRSRRGATAWVRASMTRTASPATTGDALGDYTRRRRSTKNLATTWLGAASEGRGFLPYRRTRLVPPAGEAERGGGSRAGGPPHAAGPPARGPHGDPPNSETIPHASRRAAVTLQAGSIVRDRSTTR